LEANNKTSIFDSSIQSLSLYPNVTCMPFMRNVTIGTITIENNPSLFGTNLQAKSVTLENGTYHLIHSTIGVLDIEQNSSVTLQFCQLGNFSIWGGSLSFTNCTWSNITLDHWNP
jgi:hypothetical protein